MQDTFPGKDSVIDSPFYKELRMSRTAGIPYKSQLQNHLPAFLKTLQNCCEKVKGWREFNGFSSSYFQTEDKVVYCRIEPFGWPELSFITMRMFLVHEAMWIPTLIHIEAIHILRPNDQYFKAEIKVVPLPSLRVTKGCMLLYDFSTNLSACKAGNLELQTVMGIPVEPGTDNPLW